MRRDAQLAPCVRRYDGEGQRCTMAAVRPWRIFARTLAQPRHICARTWARPSHIGTGIGSQVHQAEKTPGPACHNNPFSSFKVVRRAWRHPSHSSPGLVPHPPQDRARPSHIRPRTGLAPSQSRTRKGQVRIAGVPMTQQYGQRPCGFVDQRATASSAFPYRNGDKRPR